MKNLLLGLCLVGLTFACKSNDTAKVDDAGNPNLPAAECGTDCESACCASECSADKAECSAKKAECSAEKAECSSQKVCPMTGKPMN